jgi:hypothetical protein
MKHNPNFQEMSRKELRAYVLAHRDDDEAFYAYVDKINKDGNRTEHPPLKSMEDMENYPEFIEKLRRDPGRQV